MILKDKFYSISEISTDNNSIRAILCLNEGHEIFKAHFAGHPVVPGVCMLQIIKELLEGALDKALRLSNANELKFLTVINPAQHKLIHAEVIYTGDIATGISINARLYLNQVIFFKCKAIFKGE